MKLQGRKIKRITNYELGIMNYELEWRKGKEWEGWKRG